MKNNKGITLIALVVTIIVLLILAGVSIAMLTGQNGILTNANKAREESSQGSLDEAAKIAVGNIMTTELSWPYTGKETGSDLEKVQKEITDEITKVNSGITFAASGAWNLESGSTTKYQLTATVNDKTQSVYIDLATGAITEK